MKKKSTFSGGDGCLEVDLDTVEETGRVVIYDSKDPTKVIRGITKQRWQEFIQGVKAGEFDNMD